MLPPCPASLVGWQLSIERFEYIINTIVPQNTAKGSPIVYVGLPLSHVLYLPSLWTTACDFLDNSATNTIGDIIFKKAQTMIRFSVAFDCRKTQPCA